MLPDLEVKRLRILILEENLNELLIAIRLARTAGFEEIEPFHLAPTSHYKY
jgi:hypothetical protein